MIAVKTMTDRSNEPKLLTGNEEPLDDFSASVESKIIIENIYLNLQYTAGLLNMNALLLMFIYIHTHALYFILEQSKVQSKTL